MNNKETNHFRHFKECNNIVHSLKNIKSIHFKKQVSQQCSHVLIHVWKTMVLIFIRFVCLYVCMYVCVYVCMSHPLFEIMIFQPILEWLLINLITLSSSFRVAHFSRQISGLPIFSAKFQGCQIYKC